MDRQPDDINRYVRLKESHNVFTADENSTYSDIEIVNTSSADQLFKEDIGDLMFKLRSYSEPDENLDYARGVEEGLALAANMLESLLERHSGHSGK